MPAVFQYVFSEIVHWPMLGLFVGSIAAPLMIVTIGPNLSANYSLPRADRRLNQLQAWLLQHPQLPLNRLLIKLFSFIEGLIANSPTYLDAKRQVLGPNFCCAGQIVLGEFNTLEAALTSPQARTWQLGTTLLDPGHAPNLDGGGRNLFLLALSDQSAGGNGDREAFRHCMEQYLFNTPTCDRQRDGTAQQLLQQLAADYRQMPHAAGGAFFTDPQRGWMGFLVRYMHYVMFGLDPNDRRAIALLTDLHYTRQGTLHYFSGVGHLLQQLNLKGHGNLPDLIEQATTIYENTPALANFQAVSAQGNSGQTSPPLTRRELAKLMTAIMSIAALQGPLHLGYTAMGFRPLPAYQGRRTAEIQPTQYWDALDLTDRDAIKRYLLECGRLWAPVSATHRVATESFTATIAGKARTFPAGTRILIPMSLGLLDEGFWGPTAYDFDAQRQNLCPFHMGFHSVGDRHAGRICPGKDIALEMMVDVLKAVGDARRAP